MKTGWVLITLHDDRGEAPKKVLEEVRTTPGVRCAFIDAQSAQIVAESKEKQGNLFDQVVEQLRQIDGVKKVEPVEAIVGAFA